MTHWLYRFRINVTLPLLLLTGTLLLAATYIGALLHSQRETIRESSQRELTHEVTRMQRVLQYLLDRDDRLQLREEVASFGPDIQVRLALVTDAHDRVIASTQRNQRDEQIEQALLAADLGRLREPLAQMFASGRGSRAAITRYLPDSQMLIAAVPLNMPAAKRKLGPPEQGMFVLGWDLSHPFGLARQNALHTSWHFAPAVLIAYLSLWGLIHRVLGRRLRLLSLTAERIAGGADEVRAAVDGKDEIGRLAGAFNRMTETFVAEHQRLQDSERRLSLSQAFSNIGSWEWNIASGEVVWTPNVYRMFGVPEFDHAVSYQRYLEKILPADRAVVERAVRETLESGRPYEVEHRLQRDDGDIRWLKGTGDVLRDDQGRPLRMYGVVQDITEQKRAEEALYREKEHAQVTLASIGDGVITTDTAGNVRFLNPVAEYLTGWKNEQALGKPLTEVFNILNELTHKPAMNPVARCLREGHIVGLANHTVLVRTDAREFAIEDSAAPIRASDGTLIGVVLVFHDVTKAREMANRLSWQASHDALTGLYNRMAFEERLRQLVRFPDNPRGGDQHTLLYIDLDQFKVVNDIAGHIAGDEMLKQVGAIMQHQIRDTDMLARLGGDEFGVVLTHCDLAHAQRVADGMLQSLDDYKFSWDERVFRVSASIGVLEFRPGESSLTELLSAADMACYAAKNAGRRRTHVYQVDDVHMQRHRSEMDWAARINDAVEENRLVLYGQTICRLNNGQMPPGLAFEVLVRMRDKSGELIAPGVFLPAAERFDLISIVDRWIITRAFSMVADYIARHGETHIAHCAINLSGGTLGDDTLLPFIKTQLSLHNLPARVFCFEITETAAISNFQSALRFIRDLRAMGCRFALDDFGSGLSSFSYLKNLPVDYLKIDGTFVRGIAADPVNRTLVGNINDIGHLLGKHTIAEYAEDDAAIAVLRELGVDYAQGYGISKPQPLEILLTEC